jgi:hypothetical protein
MTRILTANPQSPPDHFFDGGTFESAEYALVRTALLDEETLPASQARNHTDGNAEQITH